jgi:hypothetical protein
VATFRESQVARSHRGALESTLIHSSAEKFTAPHLPKRASSPFPTRAAPRRGVRRPHGDGGLRPPDGFTPAMLRPIATVHRGPRSLLATRTAPTTRRPPASEPRARPAETRGLSPTIGLIISAAIALALALAATGGEIAVCLPSGGAGDGEDRPPQRESHNFRMGKPGTIGTLSKVDPERTVALKS